jgi:RNA polymerase sigma-70 factor (ECF subfamily)
MVESMINKGLIMNRKTKISSNEFLIYLKPHKHKLFNFIQKCLKFSEDAEDIYQNVIINSYRAIHKFKGNSTFKTWIFSIANNEIIKYFKKKKRNDYICYSLQENHPQSNSSDRELINSLFEIAAKFSSKNRNIFFLFYYNGFTIDEIFQITGIRSGTIKYILNNCREKIKDLLRED